MENSSQIYSAMQLNKPFKTYRKTILAKVSVNILDPFTDIPTGILLTGNPKTDSNASIDLWSEKEDVFFKRMNKRHFEIGNLLEIVRVEEVRERTIESYTDEELSTIINSKFLSLQSILNKTDSVAVLLRMIDLAEGLEKSDKIMSALKSRLSELQSISTNIESVTVTL